MSSKAKYEYLLQIRERYRRASKKEKKVILDEFCKVCGYNRKYAITLLNKPVTQISADNLSRRGRHAIYDHILIETVLFDIWKVTNMPCSKRLKAIIREWLPFYDKHQLPDEIRRQLLSISPATIDRLLKPHRHRYGKKGLATTKPGSLLKKHIPVKTNQWNEQKPGFLETDTVAHCGTSMAGMFAFTINSVDIFSQWTVQRAVWGKGEKGVLNAISDMERQLPFPIKGFDCDNGSEFLNWHLIRYFQDRKQPVQFSRSRPYHKNDNAHIENKNWTHIRQYLGYGRFDDPRIVDMLNDLYQNEWYYYFNFFISNVKLIKKERIGSKIIKKYDKPITPFQRLLASNHINEETKQRLQHEKDKLNPFEIQRQMTKKIEAIMKLVYQ